MSRYTIQMVGIMYFHVCDTDAKRVLIPNGMVGNEHVPPHFARLYIERDLCRYVDWWPGYVHERAVQVEGGMIVPTLELRIPERVEITFEDEENGEVHVGNIDKVLRKLSDEPGFKLDATNPDTIAEVPIRGGKLEAFTFGRGNAVAWTIERNAPMTIRATSRPHGTRRGSVTVVPTGGPRGSEVVLLHAQELLQSSGQPHHDRPVHDHSKNHVGNLRVDDDEAGLHHYKLYARLDQNRDESKVNFTPMLPHRKGILDDVIDARLNNSCTPDCC